MLRIGITGGIGSGKTTVCKLFELQGIPVFYSDAQARTAMNTDLDLADGIRQTFGKDIYFENGLLDRKKLASIVFSDDSKLKELNALVHPAVFRRFHIWSAEQTSPYVLKEAAILFESDSYKDCDGIILVKAPLDLKIARVIKRDAITKQEVLNRMEKQLSDEEKLKLSDFIIENDEKQLLVPQVLKLHQQLLNKASIK